MDLSWLCFVAIMLIMIPAIYYGTRSRLRYARRIREAQAKGAFADMNTPENQYRFRRFAFLALIGVIGLIISIVMLIQPWIRIPLPFSVFIVAFVVFGIMASVGGFLMQREIERRL
jgi:hypothetical protein